MLIELTDYKTGRLVLVDHREIGLCRRNGADPLTGSIEHTGIESRSGGLGLGRGWWVGVKETPEEIRDLIAKAKGGAR